MAPRRCSKKQRVEQSMATRTIEKLNSLKFEDEALNNDAKENIKILKPGLGLLGNEEEEKQYYADAVKEGVPGPTVVDGSEEIGAPDRERSQPAEESDQRQVEVEGVEMAGEGVVVKEEETSDQETADVEDGNRLPESDEDEDFGKDFLEFNGEHVHLSVFLGQDWVERIKALHAVETWEQPKHMNLVLHHHQLKGAAQMDFLCRSAFQGGILGDAMGLGKTHAAILTLAAVKDEPGFSLVICPRTLCLQWKYAIDEAWQEGHGLKAFLLGSTGAMTAHELLALGVDVVICTYEQVEASERERRNLLDALDAYNSDVTGKLPKPKRPDAVLHSSFWKRMDLPIKRLVIDEAHLVNKRGGIRHRAIMSLHYTACICLTGSPSHNKWDNFSGLIDFLKGHPFTTHGLFMRTFAVKDYDGKITRPDSPRLTLLQRFLQGFTIARPVSILDLKSCDRYRYRFSLDQNSATQIETMVEKYLRMVHMTAKEGGNQNEKSEAQALALAVQAQMLALHPMLLEEEAPEQLDDLDENDPVLGYNEADRDANGGEKRSKWLEKVAGRVTLREESDRVRRFLAVYEEMRQLNPDCKMVVFSQYLKFLDILATALKQHCGVQALRFDGTMDQNKRFKTQQLYKDADPSVPLLITAGAGAYGLNITEAKVVILTEVWWNLSVELQAICRAWRQGQESNVLVIQLFAENSAIDREIAVVQKRKACVTDELMSGIIRLPDEEPVIRDLPFAPVVAYEGLIRHE